jgi:hypothetical protein
MPGARITGTLFDIRYRETPAVSASSDREELKLSWVGAYRRYGRMASRTQKVSDFVGSLCASGLSRTSVGLAPMILIRRVLYCTECR